MKYHCLNCWDPIKVLLLSGGRELDALECDACGAYPLCFNCTLCPECAKLEREMLEPELTAPPAGVAERIAR